MSTVAAPAPCCSTTPKRFRPTGCSKRGTGRPRTRRKRRPVCRGQPSLWRRPGHAQSAQLHLCQLSPKLHLDAHTPQHPSGSRDLDSDNQHRSAVNFDRGTKSFYPGRRRNANHYGHGHGVWAIIISNLALRTTAIDAKQRGHYGSALSHRGAPHFLTMPVVLC